MRAIIVVLCAGACASPQPATTDAPIASDAVTVDARSADAELSDAAPAPSDAPAPDAAPSVETASMIVAIPSPYVYGTIAFTPPCQQCNGGCCFDTNTSVQLTATPAAGAHFVAWSGEAACGSSPTCTITTDSIIRVVTAVFAPDRTGLSIDFAGNAVGDVAIAQPGGSIVAQCTASCTVAVDSGQDVVVMASTPADFVGFDAPCTAGARDCLLPAGTSTVAVDFTHLPGEVDLRIGGSSIDYDDAGELLIATADDNGPVGVTVLSPSLAMKWSLALAGRARFAPDGHVFVSARDGVHAIDPSGSPIWTRASATPVRDLVPTPSGGVVLLHDGGVEIWDATGAAIASPTVDMTPAVCVAAGRDGTIYVGHVDLSVSDNYVVIERFDASGARVSPDLPLPPRLGFSDERLCDVAAGTGQIAVTEKGELEDWVGVVQLAYDGTVVAGTSYDLPTTDAETSRHEQVATNAADEIAWFGPDPDPQIAVPAYGMHLEKRAANGALLWSVLRPAAQAGVYTGFHFDNGLQIRDVAIAPDGHVAVAGVHHGVGVSSYVLEVFPP